MCRNITILRGLQPAATAEEIEAAARQYVRKVSGVQTVSAANEEPFELAVRRVTEATTDLLADAAAAQAAADDRAAAAPHPDALAGGPLRVSERVLERVHHSARSSGQWCTADDVRRVAKRQGAPMTRQLGIAATGRRRLRFQTWATMSWAASRPSAAATPTMPAQASA